MVSTATPQYSELDCRGNFGKPPITEQNATNAMRVDRLTLVFCESNLPAI